MTRVEDVEPLGEFPLAFARAFRGIADDAGVRQDALAARLDTVQSYISDRMRGVRAIDQRLVEGLAAEMRISPRDLTERVLRRMAAEGSIATGEVIN